MVNCGLVITDPAHNTTLFLPHSMVARHDINAMTILRRPAPCYASDYFHTGKIQCYLFWGGDGLLLLVRSYQGDSGCSGRENRSLAWRWGYYWLAIFTAIQVFFPAIFEILAQRRRTIRAHHGSHRRVENEQNRLTGVGYCESICHRIQCNTQPSTECRKCYGILWQKVSFV